MNAQATANFNISEMLSWPMHQNMTQADRALVHRLIAETYTPEIDKACRAILLKAQNIRDWINLAHPEAKGKIGLRVLSGYRPHEWELYRRRLGGSQHVKGWAMDFMPVNSGKDQAIAGEIFAGLKDWDGGLARKFTGGKYTFIHIDLGEKRRWEY